MLHATPYTDIKAQVCLRLNQVPSRTTELISTRSSLGPKFIYVCSFDTNKLDRVNLLTGELSTHQIPGYEFKFGCCWSEHPGGNLLITGGYSVREVVRIDTLREFAVSCLPSMRTARWSHAAVYHSQYLYVLGGRNFCDLNKCERYLCADSRWERLPALPVPCCDMSAVVLDSSLYALGGKTYKLWDTVQKLSLDSLHWQLIQLTCVKL
jgi:hypothetical protein